METKFNLNRPPISDEEINSKKDFGELIKQFKNQSIQKARNDRSFFKNKKATYSAVIAGVAVICTVTYFSVFKNNKTHQPTHDKTTTTLVQSPKSKVQISKFIAPPIKKITVPYTIYKVNADKGAELTHSTASKIKIPKKAFVNKQGIDIVGDVEIQYREFHNQADIIASGIPMRYDSAGVESHLESAGMIDIKGFQNGEPVYVNPKKQIIVEFASEHKNDKYNMYRLDTVAKNWTYLSRDNSLMSSKLKVESSKSHTKPISSSDVENSKTNALEKQLAEIPPKIENAKIAYTTKINTLPKATQPLKPSKATASRPQFELDVNYKEFPELEAFKNAVFEVGEENKNYSSKMADVTWSSAQISEGPQKNKNYILTLKLGKQVQQLIVYPALTGTNFDNAIKLYEKKFADYKTMVAKRDADEQRLKTEFEAKQKAYVEEQKKLEAELVKERIKLREQQEQQLSEQFNTLGNQQRVLRIFQVSSFGIYNSDCPASLPKEATVNPIYVMANSQTNLSPTNVYLICHSKNLVYNLQYGTLKYNPAEAYSLCLIANGKTYLCSKELFASVTTKNQNTFVCTELNANIDNAYDFKKALGLL